jgi:hypothetical protein
MLRLLLHRETSGGASQEIWVTPQSVFISDNEPPGLGVSIWSFITFPSLESVITDALQLSSADPHITDKRSTRFALRSLVKPGDPQCVQGLLIDPTQKPEVQAKAAWQFYWERASSHLHRLSSIEILSDLRYVPPGTSGVAWSTRQLLYHANHGQFSLCDSIARGVEKTAPSELVAPVKALIALAAARGDKFMPSASALDYKRHPLWLEFEAVRSHASRIA